MVKLLATFLNQFVITLHLFADLDLPIASVSSLAGNNLTIACPSMKPGAMVRNLKWKCQGEFETNFPSANYLSHAPFSVLLFFLTMIIIDQQYQYKYFVVIFLDEIPGCNFLTMRCLQQIFF
jgi:hypothetical protein